MSTRIGVTDLRATLARVLDESARGRVYLVTRSGREIAVIGPSSGAVSRLAIEATDCLRDLRDAEAQRDAYAAETARLRSRNTDLEEQLHNLREQLAAQHRSR